MSVVRAYQLYHIGVPVNDLEKAKDFYVNVLGLNVIPDRRTGSVSPRVRSRGSPQVRLYCGDKPTPGQEVVLFERPKPVERDSRTTQEASLKGYEGGEEHHGSLLLQDGSTHNAFLVSAEDLDKALARFKEMGIVVVAAPTSVFGKHRSISLFDPDGNKIQLSDGLD
jgi:catechol 2,3-dioxygenase-like lactoylglutathione lyase family enzyme